MIKKRMHVHIHDKTRGREQNQTGSIFLFRWHASFFSLTRAIIQFECETNFGFVWFHITSKQTVMRCWDAVHISSGCMCCFLIRPLLVKPQRNDRHTHKHFIHSQWLTNSSKNTLDTPWNQAWPFVIKPIDVRPSARSVTTVSVFVC